MFKYLLCVILPTCMIIGVSAHAASQPAPEIYVTLKISVKADGNFKGSCNETLLNGTRTTSYQDNYCSSYSTVTVWKVVGTIRSDDDQLNLKLVSDDYEISASGSGSLRSETVNHPSPGETERAVNTSNWTYDFPTDSIPMPPTIILSPRDRTYRIDINSIGPGVPETVGTTTFELHSSDYDMEQTSPGAAGGSIGQALSTLCETVMIPDEDDTRLTGAFNPYESFTVSGSAYYDVSESDMYEPYIMQPMSVFLGPGAEVTGTAGIKVSYTLTYGGKPEPEVWLKLNDRNWLPTDNNQVHVTLTCEDDTPSAVKFQLAEVSQEPGTCMNSEDEGTDPDIEFDESNKANGFQITGGVSASAEKTGNCGRDETVTLLSSDWGAWCRVSAQAQIDGKWVKAKVDGGGTTLTVPRDKDNNRVGDAWQEERGVQMGTDATWDEANIPGGQYNLGDGISLYEKYRGFMLGGAHERLEPQYKHLFIYDPTGVVHRVENELAQGRSLSALSQLRLRYVKDNEWSGPGSSSAGKRVVNKNSGWGHNVDQHALHVELYSGDIDWSDKRYPVPPGYADWRQEQGKQATANVEGAPGYCFPDTSNRLGGSPKDTIIIVIWEKILLKHVIFGAVIGQAATVALDKYGEDNITLDNVLGLASDGAQRMAAYAESHPDQLQMAYDRLLAHVVVHEILHGINVQHCDVDFLCVMNVPAFILNPMQVAFGSSPVFIASPLGFDDDPFGLEEDWPDHLCKPCFSSIAVSDDSSL